MEPHPCQDPIFLPKHNTKSPQRFYQYSLEALLLRKWHEFGNASGTLISTADELAEHPADIVVVPSTLAGAWIGPDNHKIGVNLKHFQNVSAEKEAIVYWDRLRTRFCRRLDGASEPSCPVIVTHLPFVVNIDGEKCDIVGANLLMSLVQQPHYFQGRVVIAGIESNLPLKMSDLQSKIRTFISIIRDASTKIIPTKPLFLTVPYPTFELPDPAATDSLYRDKLLSSYWGATCASRGGRVKEKNSGGVRSALEKFLYNHPNHSCRGRDQNACELGKHAICVKGNECALTSGTEAMSQLAATSRFCLEPGGDTPTRSHFYVSAIFGCIPILLDGGSAEYGQQVTQWPWRMGEDQGIGLKYEDFSIILKADDVARDPSLVLQAIEKSDYGALQTGLAKAVQSLSYSNDVHTHDAFTNLETVVCAETGRNIF